LEAVPSVTLAPKSTAAPAEIEVAGVPTSEITTTGGVIIITAEALLVGSATEVAVIVTVPPGGTAVGAI
jgi:hypothetical protein